MVGKKCSQHNIQLEKIKSLLLSFEFTNMLKKKKKTEKLHVQIYIVVVPIVSVLEMALGHLLLYF